MISFLLENLEHTSYIEGFSKLNHKKCWRSLRCFISRVVFCLSFWGSPNVIRAWFFPIYRWLFPWKFPPNPTEDHHNVSSKNGSEYTLLNWNMFLKTNVWESSNQPQPFKRNTPVATCSRHPFEWPSWWGILSLIAPRELFGPHTIFLWWSSDSFYLEEAV